MSNFTGVTFAEQAVTPSDDAIVRRAILPDGILSGCELSYSGSTLTMAAGHLMVCGRQIRHPSAQNWAVVDATSGYARLLLTIDLTRTATEETFDQVVDSIEYASAEDGFVDLEQADINRSGTRYQVAVCVVSLGTGGITGIVSRLEKCEVGAGLNFNVVGGLTQPTGPKENTIWVNTGAKITGWYFSATQPENMAEGEVWLLVGSSSQTAFNALRKNAVMVYPVSAKQMVDGVLMNVTAKSYQGGEWVEWYPIGVLYYYGYENTEVTGGWVKPGRKTTGNQYDSYGTTGYVSTTEKREDSIYLFASTSDEEDVSSASIFTVNKVDLSNYSTLYVELSDVDGEVGVKGYEGNEPFNFYSNYSFSGAADSKGIFSIDISGVNTKNHILIGMIAYSSSGGTSRTATIKRVWLE